MGSKERKEREKDNRRDEIIHAGEKLFLEKGLSSTTMEQIARECELAKGTLYLYFKSKEQLYLTIMLRAITLMYDLMAASQTGLSDPVLRLAKIGDAHERFYEENPDLFRIISRFAEHEFFAGDDVQEIAGQLQQKHRDIWELINGIIIDGMASGVFRKDTDAMEIAIGLHAISMSMTIMIDQSKSMREQSDGKIEIGVSKETLQRMMSRNCGRLIYTILADPSEAADYIRRLRDAGSETYDKTEKKTARGAKEAK